MTSKLNETFLFNACGAKTARRCGRGVAIAAGILLFGCGSNEVKQSDYDLQQRRQIEQDNAAREAKVRQEQEELARIREQRRLRDEAAQRAQQTETPVIRPLNEEKVEERTLPDSAATPDDQADLKTLTIYYDYDAYNIKEQYRKILEAHARYLLQHPGSRMRIEGHCDERGSREYNLALGQRRADSIKRALTLLGVPGRQVQAVSFGSEKPKATGQNEQAYAQNRRSDLSYEEPRSASR